MHESFVTFLICCQISHKKNFDTSPAWCFNQVCWYTDLPAIKGKLILSVHDFLHKNFTIIAYFLVFLSISTGVIWVHEFHFPKTVLVKKYRSYICTSWSRLKKVSDWASNLGCFFFFFTVLYTIHEYPEWIYLLRWLKL